MHTNVGRLVLFFCLLWSAPLLALPEDPGTLQVAQSSRTETIAGSSLDFDLYVPKTSKPCPIIVLAHGFMRSKALMVDWGTHLASRGYIVMTPSFALFNSDHAAHATSMSGLLDWAVTQNSVAGSPLSNLVDGSRRVVMGHSAGGLSAVLAGASDSKISLVIGLDPVDVSDLGKTAAPSIKVPVTLVRAKPAPCNSDGNAAAMFAGLTVPAFTVEVVNATHCDPEWPSDPACGLLCGSDDATRRKSFVRYAMATLDYVLMCDKTMEPWLGGASAKADTAVQNIATKSYPPGQLGCAAKPDSGPVKSDARLDGGSAKTEPGSAADRSTTTGDHASIADTASTTPQNGGGCSCTLSRDARPGDAPLLLLLGGAILALCARRRPTR
jgi:predicted dienelactone hydrolase